MLLALSLTLLPFLQVLFTFSISNTIVRKYNVVRMQSSVWILFAKTLFKILLLI